MEFLNVIDVYVNALRARLSTEIDAVRHGTMTVSDFFDMTSSLSLDCSDKGAPEIRVNTGMILVALLHEIEDSELLKEAAMQAWQTDRRAFENTLPLISLSDCIPTATLDGNASPSQKLMLIMAMYMIDAAVLHNIDMVVHAGHIYTTSMSNVNAGYAQVLEGMSPSRVYLKLAVKCMLQISNIPFTMRYKVLQDQAEFLRTGMINATATYAGSPSTSTNKRSKRNETAFLQQLRYLILSDHDTAMVFREEFLDFLKVTKLLKQDEMLQTWMNALPHPADIVLFMAFYYKCKPPTG